MSVSRLIWRGFSGYRCALLQCRPILESSKIIYSSNDWYRLQASQSRYLVTGIVVRQQESAQEEQKDNEIRDPSKDRTKVIPVETSIKYLESAAYKETYGEGTVWREYRRNHKGALAPRKTRRTCIRKGITSTGNPCPICRDEYLVLDYRNIKLLEQFISPHTGEILSYRATGLCQVRHQELLVAVERARDAGLITFDVPFREYDYSNYSKPLSEDNAARQSSKN